MNRGNKISTVSLFLITILFSFTSYAQNNDVIINGEITNNSPDIEGIHILNISSLVATITKRDGTFQISGKVNDTLLISSIQYEIQKIVLTETIINSKKLAIRLYIKVNELDEVIVKPHNLSGDLSRDLRETTTAYESVRPSKLGLPNAYVKRKTQTERRIYEAKSGGGILPLNPIINAITGRTRKLKNQLRLERKEQKLEDIRGQYDREIYSDFLKVPEEKLDDFMHFCAVDPAFTAIEQAGDTILMLEFLKKKSDEYRKINELD